MVEGLGVIWAPVRDMARGVAFYRDVLGLTPGYESPHWTEFLLPNGKLALHWFPEVTSGMSWAVTLLWRDLDALEARLQGTEATVVGRHETPSGVFLEFRDPDGNTIQALSVE